MLLLVAALLLLLNDHVLKGAGVVPGLLTGKLSDVCGLFAASVLVARLARAVLGESKRRDAVVCAAAAIAFALVKTTHGVNAIYEAILGPTRIDPSDLVALPAALGAYAALRAPTASRPWRDRAGLVLAALGCMATSPQRPPPPPQPPVMQVAQPPACAAVIGAALEPRGATAAVHVTLKSSSAADCDVTVDVRLDARTTTPGVEVSVSGNRGPITVAAGATVDVEVTVSGPYPMRCDPDARANWDVTSSLPNQSPSKNPGGGRIGCWHSAALAAPSASSAP